MSKNDSVWRMIAIAAVAVAISSISQSVFATWPSGPDVAITRGFSVQGTAVQSGDNVINNGVYDVAAGTWVRLEGTGGSLTTGTCTTFNTDHQSVSTSAAVPTTALTNRLSICVFNEDTAVTVWCTDATPATATNGAMIEPRTGRCFGANTLYCFASSAVTIDYTECGS